MQIIDLSVSIDDSFWEPNPIRRKIISHKKGANILGKSYLKFKNIGYFKRLLYLITKNKSVLINYKDFPDEMGLSLMEYTLTTHTGTHLDAPYHYGWRKDCKEKSKTVTEIPLEWCFSDGVLLDFSNYKGKIDVNAIENRLHQIEYQIKERDIILINTGSFKHIGKKQYFTNYRGIERCAVQFLINNGIKIIGTDAFSFDMPFCQMIDAYKSTGDKNCLWPAHIYGREREYIQIERLGYLEKIPFAKGFKICCFPIKLKDADAAWSRVVAIIH